MAIDGYVVLTLKFQKSGRRWTAYCEELGTTAFGRSLSEADKRIKEAVLLHLNTLEDVGERKRFFKENHIKFHQTKPKDDITICLPPKSEVFVESHIQRLPALSGA